MSLDAFWSQSDSTSKQARRNTRQNKSAIAEQDGDNPAASNEAALSGDAVNCIVEKVSIVLEKKLQAIRDPISEISGKLDNMIKRVIEAEQRISDLEDNQVNSSTRLGSIESSLQKALEHIEDLENRSRRQNIRIVGLKEGTEGGDPIAFFETWIPTTLNVNAEDGRIKLDRAHRTGPLRKEDEHPRARPVIVRLHNYKDKRLILEAARRLGDLCIDGKKVSFFQDFSAGVQKKRAETAEARRRLREAGFKYAFIYPATIRVFNVAGKNTYLSTSAEVNAFLESTQQT